MQQGGPVPVPEIHRSMHHLHIRHSPDIKWACFFFFSSFSLPNVYAYLQDIPSISNRIIYRLCMASSVLLFGAQL
jgi:hypothetical protein